MGVLLDAAGAFDCISPRNDRLLNRALRVGHQEDVDLELHGQSGQSDEDVIKVVVLLLVGLVCDVARMIHHGHLDPQPVGRIADVITDPVQRGLAIVVHDVDRWFVHLSQDLGNPLLVFVAPDGAERPSKPTLKELSEEGIRTVLQ